MREGQSQILKGQKMDQILTGGAAIATAVAAVFGLLAATTKVHDNIDRFMIDLERQGRLAAWAAFANAVAAAFLIFQTVSG
jgi:hypothetical protein